MIKTNQLPEKHIFVCENLREPSSGRLPCAACGSRQIRAELKKKLFSMHLE